MRGIVRLLSAQKETFEMRAEMRTLAVVVAGIVAASMAGMAQRNEASPFESQIRGLEIAVASTGGEPTEPDG